MLKPLVRLAGWCEGEAMRTGAETLLRLWAERCEQHPCMFYMGTYGTVKVSVRLKASKPFAPKLRSGAG